MGVIRKTLALLAWIIIEIPTTLFVVFVMIKAFLEQLVNRKRAKSKQGQRKEELA